MGSVPWSDKAPGNAFFIILRANGADGPNKPNRPDGPDGTNKPNKPNGTNGMDRAVMLAAFCFKA